MSTRRQFLTITSAAALSSALPVKAFAAPMEDEVFSNRNLGAYSQGLLTLETFQPLVGSQFRVFLADGSVAYLTLATVTDRNAATARAGGKTAALHPGVAAASSAVRRAPASPATTAFDLEFIARGPALEQKTYTVDHARLGRFAAFLVPAQQGVAGNKYCMSFNFLTAVASASGPAGGLHISQPQEASSIMLR